MFCECFTTLFQFVRRQLLWTWFFPPWCHYCVAHEVSLLTGHRGNELISLSTQIVCFCYSCHISVRCGSSSSWNNEAMFHDYWQNSLDIYVVIIFLSNSGFFWLFYQRSYYYPFVLFRFRMHSKLAIIYHKTTQAQNSELKIKKAEKNH